MATARSTSIPNVCISPGSHSARCMEHSCSCVAGCVAAAFNVGGGSVIDIAIFSKPNAFGIQPAYRDRPVKVNSDPGRSDAETYVELIDWLQAIGDPISTAPHLTRSPLTGVPEKRVLFQFAKGDRPIPNPASSNLSRQAGAKASTVIYRHDIARSASPGISQNPHTFLTDISSAAAFAVAQAAQSQISSFLQSDGTTIPDANNKFLNMFFLGNRVFEWPTIYPKTWVLKWPPITSLILWLRLD